MIPILIPALIQFLPGIISSVELLSRHRAAAIGEPLPGALKLNAVTTLTMTALQMAELVDPKHVGKAETELAQDVTNAIVKYINAKGAFAQQNPAVAAAIS